MELELQQPTRRAKGDLNNKSDLVPWHNVMVLVAWRSRDQHDCDEFNLTVKPRAETST